MLCDGGGIGKRVNEFPQTSIGGLVEYLSSDFRPAWHSFEIPASVVFDLGRRGVGLVFCDEGQVAVEGCESEGKGWVFRRMGCLGFTHLL